MALPAVDIDADEHSSSRHILIVDDDPDFTEGLDIILSSEGHRVSYARDRQTAIKRLDDLEPDLALIDLHLANSSGLDLISELTQLRPVLVCVIMTAYASTDSAIKALQHGAYDYLMKPIGESELFATLSRCFERADLIRQKAEAESALREAQDWFQNLVDFSPMAFNLKDLDGRYRVVNQRFEEWFGIDASAAIGKTSHDVFSAEFADIYTAQDRAVVFEREFLEQECNAPFADGTTHRLVISKYPVFDRDGELIGIGSINTDVTAARQVEQKLRQAQKMEAIGQLTGGLAHDLNNILAVIQGGVELLADDGDSNAVLLGSILNATARGSNLTRRLLAFSRKQPLQSQAIDLGDLLSSMSELLSRTLGETIEFNLQAEPGLWAVMADARQVENAVLNLAINARDAMPGGGRLTIACKNIHLGPTGRTMAPEILAGEYVQLTVSDEGIGMSEQECERAFEPFFTTKDEDQGTGLGLSMVYGFAKQSGGYANIRSEPGKGTTVNVYLPRTEVPCKARDLNAGGSVPSGQGESILVIENDPDVRAITVRVLETLCYSVIDVSQASDARNVLSEATPVDLVLSDVVLPGGTSGPELAEEIAQSRPDLPFVFMSGYSIEAADPAGLLSADNILLSKPFNRQELSGTIRQVLQQSGKGKTRNA